MPPPTPADDAPWYQSSFGDDYARIYAHRDQAEAQLAVHALLDRVALPPGARVLDLCCGWGRHLRTLIDRHLDPIGIDLSADLLARAAQHPDLRRRLIRADMRQLPLRSHSVRAVFNFFSSFGYFPHHTENARVIHEIARILQPGGLLAMDFLNAPKLRRTLVPEDSRQLDHLHLTQRRWIDPHTDRVEKELILRDTAGTRHYRESVQLYTLPDFTRFFTAAGLTLVAHYGSPHGDPWTDTADRLVMIARKP